MKTIILLALTYSLQAYSLPAKLQLTGQMQFESDKTVVPTTINLVLKKEKTNSAKYKGALTYTYNNKQYQNNIELDLKTNKKTISAYVRQNFDYKLVFTGSYDNLANNEVINLQIKQYEEREKCTYHGPEHDESCHYQSYLIDKGNLRAVVK